jgi:hypothetical protein
MINTIFPFPRESIIYQVLLGELFQPERRIFIMVWISKSGSKMFNLNNLALKQGYKLEILVLTMIRSMGSNAACQTSLPKEAEATEFPPGFPTPDPDDLEACLEAGERWEVLGFRGLGSNLPTSDAGEPCTERDDYESGCFGDPALVMAEDEFGNLHPGHEKLKN